MKTLEEFVQLVQEQFDETVGITSSTVLHELDEWSSLIALSIIAMIDEEFDVSLTGNDLTKSVTVKDLYNITISK